MNSNTMTVCTNMSMMKGIHGKVALVAGGAGGIGSTVCLMLAKHGATVVVGDVNEELAMKVAKSLPTESGAKHMAIKIDVTSMTDVHTAVEKIHKTYGKPAELAVDSAGWMGGESLLMNMKEGDFDHSIAVNLKGTYLLTQAVAKAMVNAKCPGTIVNVSSTLSLISHEEWGHLSAAEAGAKQLVHVAAREWIKHGIRVNSVLAGLIDTPCVGHLKGTEVWSKVEKESFASRVGKPEDVAEAVIFLLSESASYITGAELIVAGKPIL